MEYLDDYSPSSPLPSYSSSMRDLPPVPSFRGRSSRRRSTPGESSNVHVHAVHLKNAEGSNWATLKVQSKSAKAPVQIIQSQSIQGSLEINLTKSKSLEGISVEVHGEIAILKETTSFMFLEEPLWRSVPGNSTISGRHSLPFIFYLPEGVSIPRFASREVETPFSVDHVDVPFSITYKVVVKITRGRFKSNALIEMPFLYLPSSKAPAPSSQRQMAYRAAQVPPGPSVDPEGWYSIGRFTQRGYIFGARIVNIVFSCFLANPLSYAKGTAIPFIILASSDDEQALDLISSRKALNVSLERNLHLNIGNRNGPRTKTTVGMGSFCSPSSNIPPTGRRAIEGEIHVASDEMSSFQTSLLTCSHTVVIQLVALGFTPFSKDPDDFVADGGLSLFSQNVSITTYLSSGPRPIFRTEPVYPTVNDQDCHEGLFFMSNYSMNAWTG